MSDLEASTPLLQAGVSTSAGAESPKRRNRLVQAFLILVGAIGGSLVLYALFNHFKPAGEPKLNDWPSWKEFEGPTKTQSEAMAAATAYPETPYPLSPPAGRSDILKKLGNLTPWQSVNHGLTETTAQVPFGCSLDQVHVLHRHGARGTSGDNGFGALEARFSQTKAKNGFKGNLSFLNQWKYVLGQEVLTSFGRQQLFDLGIKYRINYGSLFARSTTLSVFRTTSQNRMRESALNFAAGFFGLDYEEKYHQLVMIEKSGFNNTLAPNKTCKNANRGDLTVFRSKMTEWKNIYLKDAVKRLNRLVEGYEFTITDVYDMQTLCAYEMVGLGGSEFCPLFTDEEFDGFEYSLDILFYYKFSFGQPAQAAIGKGWVEEFISRVTHTRLTDFDSTTNSTLHTEEYFPLENGQTVFVDATHDTIISAVLTTLNFNSFSGSLPSTHIPKNRGFNIGIISPFASNLHAQVLTCSEDSTVKEGKYIRWILNDGVVPLVGTEGCEDNKDGLCSLDSFVKSTKERLASIDWNYDCLYPYEMPEKEITDGRPPRNK